MPEIIQQPFVTSPFITSPFLTMFDREFLAYAGTDILARSLVAFGVIWIALRLFDTVTDGATRPSRESLIMRGALAFFVPFAFLLFSTNASTLPSEYRTYAPGTYEVGTTLPAGSYVLYAGAGDSSLSIRGEEGDVSTAWDRGQMSVTVYDGDELTINGCSAKNRTSRLVYNANAADRHLAIGSVFLVGGVDLRPGTYELTVSSDEPGAKAEYQVRDGFLKAGQPLEPTKFSGTAYADLHYGETLYVKGASVALYSNVFSLPKPTDKDANDEEVADAEEEAEDEDGEKAAEKDAKKDDKDTKSDKNDKDEKKSTANEAKKVSSSAKDGRDEKDAKKATKGVRSTFVKAGKSDGSQEWEAEDVNGDGAIDYKDFYQMLGDLSGIGSMVEPQPTPNYVVDIEPPQIDVQALADKAEDTDADEDADTAETDNHESFSDIIRRMAKENKLPKTVLV